MTIDTDHFRTRLQDERRRVVGALENIRSENSGSMDDEVDESHFDNHLAETASVTTDRVIDYSLEASEKRVLAAIDAALGRIDEGTFGKCERCGEPIEPDRLEALPWATLCIEDKRREEQG